MSQNLQDRRIGLLGFGIENRALAHFLQSRKIPFSVCDTRQPDAPLANVREWRIGTDYLEGLTDFDLLFRTPGLSCLDPCLKAARESGVEISSQTRLFLQLCPAPILGITGTKGKGTTTSILHALLATDAARVFSGGNIGRPPIAFLDELRSDDRVVLELSSFQLQDLDLSPHIALALSITEDHLDYHTDRAEYIAAKRPICSHQKATDILIVNQDCPTARSFAAHSPAEIWHYSARSPVAQGAWVDDNKLWARRPSEEATVICPTTDIPLRGKHNEGNAAAAVAAAIAFGAPTTDFADAIRSFKGLPHRIEYITEYKGITYYNDSLATTVDAAVAAINSFDEPLLLIAGGASKGADFSALGTCIAASSVRAVLLIGDEAVRIEAAIRQVGAQTAVRRCRDLREAITIARSTAQAGDAILLSPACASFDQFSSYAERGELFKQLVAH
jgi:UDP-N-acetylmuramoylalanine--D-glutamate ligase